jgi:hypothetical protein
MVMVYILMVSALDSEMNLKIVSIASQEKFVTHMTINMAVCGKYKVIFPGK